VKWLGKAAAQSERTRAPQESSRSEGASGRTNPGRRRQAVSLRARRRRRDCGLAVAA
jgi:hypothetical protein